MNKRMTKLLSEIEHPSVAGALKVAAGAITDGSAETIAREIVELQRARDGERMCVKGLTEQLAESNQSLAIERRRVCRWSEEAMHQRELVAQAVTVETV